MKVLHVYSTMKELVPRKGDLINEYGMNCAMSHFADVDFGMSNIGKSYDVAYIRANTEAFARAKARVKVYVASPYDGECFRKADALATLSRAWADDLHKGVILAGMNPIGEVFGKAHSVGQVVQNYFVPRWLSEKTLSIREKYKGKFIIGYFGRVTKSNDQTQFLNVFRKLMERYHGNVVFLAGITRSKEKSVKETGIVYTSYAHSDVPYAMSACDFVFVSDHSKSFDISGSMKTLEAAACGVPVVLGRSRAREELLGKDYPYFVKWDHRFKRFSKFHTGDLFKKLCLVLDNSVLRAETGMKIMQNVKSYRVKAQSKKLKKWFSKLLKVKRHRKER